MSPKKIRWLIIALIIVLGAAGCNCDDPETEAFVILQDSPADGSILSSLIPLFEWHDDESCEPDNFYVKVEKADGGSLTSELVSGLDSSLTWPHTLDEGSKYYWSTQARADTGSRGPESGPVTFYTGPTCSGETLVAPMLLDPNLAGWIEDDPYLFEWTYDGGCLPESYEIQFALDPGFTSISMTVNTTDLYAQEILMTFLDCTTMFWRVRASDGTSFGPWSDGRDFHYILSGGCYQWKYLSDDFAWINVRVYRDSCTQTGYIAAWTSTLDPGCMVDGMIIVGDATSYFSNLQDFVVDLGSGPCPSTGLDQKTAGYIATFGVLTPGTYCVTVSRNQTAENYGPINMMDGIWTGPRTHSILVEETVTFGPGVGDHMVSFVWDEIDRTLLTFPLQKVKKCYKGPEPHCPVVEFTEAGAAVPIFGRDKITEWLLSEVNGTPCYLRLEPILLEEYESEMGMRIADLEVFPKPDPCPKPETKPAPGSGPAQPTCSDYKTEPDCMIHSTDGCKWNFLSDQCDGR